MRSGRGRRSKRGEGRKRVEEAEVKETHKKMEGECGLDGRGTKNKDKMNIYFV